jgi:predicted lipoprotein with Yx(FWY)xxD motif
MSKLPSVLRVGIVLLLALLLAAIEAVGFTPSAQAHHYGPQGGGYPGGYPARGPYSMGYRVGPPAYQRGYPPQFRYGYSRPVYGSHLRPCKLPARAQMQKPRYAKGRAYYVKVYKVPKKYKAEKVPRYYVPKEVPEAVPVPEIVPEVSIPEVSISVRESKGMGAVLVGPDEMTLYVFDRDIDGVSTCYDECAQLWPPLLAAEGAELIASADVSGVLGTSMRADGTLQVTYNGQPLYYYAGDQEPGDATGHGIDFEWWAASE